MAGKGKKPTGMEGIEESAEEGPSEIEGIVKGKGVKRTATEIESLFNPAAKKSYTTKMEVWDIPSILKDLNFDINKTVELFEYEGFNPENILKIIAEKQRDSRDRQDDVIVMCILNILRGNNISNMTRTMKQDAVSRVNELRARYGLVKSVGSNRKTAITLSRVAASYPYIACHLMTLIPHGVVSRTTMQSVSEDYPDVMRHPAFGSMIPSANNEVSVNLLLAHCICQVRFSEIVNRQKGRSVKPLSDYMEDTIRFVNIARHSGFVSEEEKIEWLVKWNLITDTPPRRLPTRLVSIAAGTFISEFTLNFAELSGVIQYVHAY